VYQGFEKVLTNAMTPAQYCQQLADLFKQESSSGNLPQMMPRKS
jgi:hypothetical protein